ncbi:hypothetical protein JEM65_11845 [Gelidibacter salicanalis]|uniref:POTRA domain-containing protein n=1 Tax=Gelidibacter salicanalis TaxID=291193 RepID=A0A934KVD6_9FLAO|nr:hypothetical protein [Gelidibacter salicanalis]
MAQSLHLRAVGQVETESRVLESLNYKNSFETFNNLQIEAQHISIMLLDQGYLESDLLSLEKQTDSSYVASYRLGTLYTNARIYFTADFNNKILKLVSASITETYFEIELAKLETALQLLNTEIANNGDPFSTLQLTNIKKANGLLTANLKIEVKEQRTIDTIIVKGHDKFPKAYVRRYLKLKPKQPFNLNTIRRKTAALDNLQFASQIKEPEVLFTKDSTLLYIYVEKQKSNTFDGFLGFGTNTETNNIEFNGYLNLNLINTLNYGESLRLLYKSDESDQKTFDVKAKLPYIFGSPLGMQVGITIFKKDSSYITASQVAKIDFQINPKNSIGLGISLLTSTNLLNVDVININDFQTTFYDLSYHYTNLQRHDRLFPINFLFEITGGLGNRTLKNTDETQSKFELNTFKIFNLDDRNSIYTNINAALLNSNTFLDNELFRFGGINSIRGFEENSLLANLFGVLNTEYRYKVTNSLYINSIIDLAYYENQSLATQSKLLGLGFGFGVLTQAGLFKLNYSNGSSEDQTIKVSDSKVHLSLTATF